jgi:hypothetical protein
MCREQNKGKTIMRYRLLLMTMLTLLATVMSFPAQAGKKPEVELTPKGEKLAASYKAILDDLQNKITRAAPELDSAKRDAFMASHLAVKEVPAPPNPNNLKSAPPRYALSNEPYAIAQSNALILARGLLADVDSFLSSPALHDDMALCALITDATPEGLAAFAQENDQQEAIMAELLADRKMVTRIMELGGAFEAKYGQAMRNYKAVLACSERAKGGVFNKLALGTALEHPDGNIQPEGMTPEEVMVKMYLNYEKAYLDGILDPAFATYSDWLYRFVYPHRHWDDISWFREMLLNYRPDIARMDDYKWRYCRIVRTDVPYTSGVDRSQWDHLDYSFMQKIFFKGGICGPRAFMGKLSTSAFGIPTRGARQTGHAAMGHWTPDGWTTVFGGWWSVNWWRGRNGQDFFLETQARENPDEYTKVLRAKWTGDAFREEDINTMQYGTGGGLWDALAFYKQLAIVEDDKIEDIGTTGEELAESNEEIAPPDVDQVDIPEAFSKITVSDKGVITIPVGACIAPQNGEKVVFMESTDGGYQVHYNLTGNQPELLRYNVEVPSAGQYELSARVVNVALEGGFMIRLNRRTMIDAEVPYTVGKWANTPPVKMELREGRNSLQFTIKTPNKGLSIKEFVLTPVKEVAAVQ